MDPQKPPSRIDVIVTFGLLASIPGVGAALLAATQNVGVAIGAAMIYGGIVLVVSMITGVWQRVREPIIQGTADQILAQIKNNQRNRQYGKHLKPYLKFISFKHRTLDVKGLSTQGQYSLELEKVFVELSISPESAASGNPIRPPDELRGSHTIWEFIDNSHLQNRELVILGAPGSGKTTLLKHITLMLANKRAHKEKSLPNRLPFLLFLRDHAKTIAENPKVRLSELVYSTLERMPDKTPEGWFEKHILAGRCLIMLDGLDEIGDTQMRRQTVAWVQEQIDALGSKGNRFIVTSRPYGYRSNPLNGVIQLEVQSFNRQQIEQFVRSWYLTNEIMSQQKDDFGVKMAADEGADDLLRRIQNAPDIAELAVNPLLLTMIATVHRFRSSLPGRRVELYAEMCEVFLGKRDQSKGENINELTPAQKQNVLQPLAYTMMQAKVREIGASQAAQIIDEPLRLVTTDMTPAAFLTMIYNRSGILIERENDEYAFSHKTFQEYLTATYLKQHQLEAVILRHIDDIYWHEVIRLYCAMADASNVISACLAEDAPIEVLVLAIECDEEALSAQPEVRQRLEALIQGSIESDDPERRKLAANVLLARRLKRLSPAGEGLFADSSLVTHAEYQLFLNEQPEHAPDHWEDVYFFKGTGRQPAVGVVGEEAEVFCAWLNERELSSEWVYRLPQVDERDQIGSCDQESTLAYLCRGSGGFIVIGKEMPPMTFGSLLITEDGAAPDPLKKTPIALRHYQLATFASQNIALARDRDRDRASARASDLARDLARDRDLALDLALDLNLASANQLYKELQKLYQSHKGDENNKKRLELYTLVAQVLVGYIQIALLLDGIDKPHLLIDSLKQGGDLGSFRRSLLQTIEAHYGRQPQRLVRGQQWEAWKAELDDLINAYAVLALLEKRRRGEMEAFEGIRIVKARRKNTTK